MANAHVTMVDSVPTADADRAALDAASRAEAG